MKSRRWYGGAAALLGGFALVLAGCGSGPSQAGSSVAPGLNNKVIKMVGGVQLEPNDYFPIVSAAACSVENASITSQMYAPLIFINNQDKIDYAQSVASSITPTKNDTVYTINLHHNWRWSNGTSVTAQDVVYAWQIIDASAQPKAPWEYCGVGAGGIPQDWKSVVATGPYTVTVTLNKPLNPVWFEYNGLSNLVPLPKQTWDKYSNMNQELAYINKISNSPSNAAFKVVDGPYAFGSYVNNEYWTLVANPKYTLKKPTIKELLFEYETSNSNLFAGLRKGQFAYAGIPTSYVKDLKQLPSYYKDENAPYSFCFNYIQPNLYSKAPGGIGPILSELPVRQALQLGIDQASIIKLYQGLAYQTYDPVPKLPNNPFFDKGLKNPYPYNIKRGIKLLEGAGWHMKNGVMTKNGKQLAFQFIVASGSNTDTNIAELIQSDWAKEGIKATIKEEPFNQVIALTDTQYQVEWWGGGWCYGATDPTGDQLFAANSPANIGMYNSPTMNRLVKASVAPQSPASATKTLDAYQAYAAKNLPVLYIPTSTTVQVVQNGLHGVNKYTNAISGYVEYNYWKVGK
jgi:peptide/nickel transport system substrate-binding protein